MPVQSQLENGTEYATDYWKLATSEKSPQNMLKINMWRIASVSLVGILTIGLFLPIIIQSYVMKRADELRPAILREFGKEQKYKLWLFNEVGGDYRQFVLLREIVRLESGWRDDVYGDSGKAYSLVQFHRPTFEQFKKEAGMDYLEYENPYNQLTLLVWAFENNYQKHWTTYQRVKRLTKK